MPNSHIRLCPNCAGIYRDMLDDFRVAIDNRDIAGNAARAAIANLHRQLDQGCAPETLTAAHDHYADSVRNLQATSDRADYLARQASAYEWNAAYECPDCAAITTPLE